MPTLIQIASLVAHTNYTGEAQPDTSNSVNAKLAPGAGIFDPDTNLLYVCGGSSLGIVHAIGSDGAVVAVLGDFGFQVDTPAGGGLRILKHPTYGKYMAGMRAAINGQVIALMALDVPGVAAGTITNSVSMVDTGLSSGGNEGRWDVDTAGNIWALTKYVSAAGPKLFEVSLTSPTTIAIAQTFDFNALHGWIDASGCLVNPLNNSLVVAGLNGASAPIIAVVSPVDGSITLSSTSLLTGNQLPFQMGLNGKFILTDGGTIDLIDAATLTSTLSVNRSSYGIGNSIEFTWYDSVNGFLWVRLPANPWAVGVLDLSNPTTAGFVQLSDPTLDAYTAEFPTIDHSVISDHTVIVSPLGNLAMTSIGTGSVSSGGVPLQFISLWGTTTLPTILIGHALNLLSARYNL